MINNVTYQRETLSERPIRQPLTWYVFISTESWTGWKRNRKIGALMEKQQQRKHRRFSGQSTVDPAPISTRVVNLSSSTLTRPEICLLDKGLKYVPTPPEVNQVEFSQDLTDYYRRIRLVEFFLDLPPTELEPFRKKRTWVPPKNRIAAMETYVQAVSTQVNNSPNPSRRTHDNLPREERQALNSLSIQASR